MGLSREEWQMWRSEEIEVPIRAVTGETPRALFVVDEDESERAVAKSQIENLDDLLPQLRRSRANQEKESLVLCVPRWLAIDNGWADDEPPE